MVQAPNARVSRVYISYSRKDEALVEELLVHLRPLEDQGLLEIFYDKLLESGQDWQTELDRRLHEADIVLFMISADALVARGVQREFNLAREILRSRGLKIFPVLLRPCAWQETPFVEFQVLPDTRPVTTWPNRDEAFLAITNSIRNVLRSSVEERMPSGAAETATPTVILPKGIDRIHLAYLAVLENPDMYALLETFDESTLAAVAQDLLGSPPRNPNDLLRERHSGSLPPPLWTAWMQTVHPAKLGLDE